MATRSPNPLDACGSCGVRSQLATADGGVVTLVQSWRNRDGTVDARCHLCDWVLVESAQCYVGWLPEPEEVEALVRETYDLAPGSEPWVGPEERAVRLRLVERRTPKRAA